MPLARSPEVATRELATEPPEASWRKNGPPGPKSADEGGSIRRRRRLPASGRKLWTLPSALDRARELPAGKEKPPGVSGGEPAPGAVVVNRGGASIDGLCRLGGKPTPQRYAGGPTSPAQAASIAAGVARCRTAARHTQAWNGRPSSSHRTHTASGVDDTATASTRDWVPSSAGTQARTGTSPLPSIGAPIASGESEYRASSGAVYRSRRRPPTPRIVRTSADT